MKWDPRRHGSGGREADARSTTYDSLLDGGDYATPEEAQGLRERRSDTASILMVLTAVLVLIWASFFERSHTERQQVLASASDLDSTLAVALDQYTVRVLKTAEAVTQLVVREYRRGLRGDALTETLEDRYRFNDVFSALAVVEASGHAVARAGAKPLLPEHIPLVNIWHAEEALRVPVQLGQPHDLAPGRDPAISIARGVQDGTAGDAEAVVVAFVDANRFLAVFESASLRPGSVVILATPEGAVRAQWTGPAGSKMAIGQVQDMRSLLAGRNTGQPTNAVDGRPRIVGVRRLVGYPLVAIVGTLVEDELAAYDARRRTWFWASLLVSVLAVLSAGALIRANRRRDRLEASLDRARLRLRSSNANLEAKVAARTAQLEEANRDLQLFSYSVAHDVRAPIATIDGFSALLEPAVAQTGDAKLVRYLAKVRGSARHMSELTESLLALARLSGASVKLQEVDLSALGDAVVNALREREPQREVAIAVEPGMRVLGDAVLLRQTLENLLGNAWKFTSRNPLARISLGCLPPERGMLTCFVSDNGAGFDMSYAGELFKPFHRLHAQRDFSGNGVGLAMVQRIVALHGGKVRAEGELGKGATFFFTLPEVK
jgi:signal transduction histidine kinase